METPSFSIIIPVYNGVSNDLSICLDSIWNQPLDKNLYEVICVDDCSTDGTRDWLDEQAKIHANLKIIKNKENIRQGGARNRGVKEASGKYILFIDQDDYYHSGSFEALYNFLKNNDLEILVSDSAFQFKGHESNKLQLNLPYREKATCEEFVMKNGFVLAPWRLAIKKTFYESTGVQFPEKCRIEDVDWAINLTYYAKEMQYQPILLVHYNKAETGTTDNMYRNKEILTANTVAGNRVLALSETIYSESNIRKYVVNMADTYYNYSMKYLLGLFCSIRKKIELINMIPANFHSKSRFVKLAVSHPALYAVLSNITVPFFRIARKIHRYRKARIGM